MFYARLLGNGRYHGNRIMDDFASLAGKYLTTPPFLVFLRFESLKIVGCQQHLQRHILG